MRCIIYNGDTIKRRPVSEKRMQRDRVYVGSHENGAMAEKLLGGDIDEGAVGSIARGVE